MQKIFYELLFGLLRLWAILPLDFLYLFQPILKFTLKDVLHYRKQVIEDNLKQSLPKYSEQELTQIKNDYYTHLSCLLLESLKSFGISKDELIERYQCLNPELLYEQFDKGQSILLLTGHCANWEWGAISAPHYLKHQAVCIYKKISNQFVEDKVNGVRAKLGVEMVVTEQTYRHIYRKSNEAPPKAYILVADQNPSNLKRAQWVNFLGRATICIHGPEIYAQRFNLPVYYIHIQRHKRGHYHCRFEPLCLHPSKTQKGEITQLYMERLEQNILEDIPAWLWSHRRWKHQPPNP